MQQKSNTRLETKENNIFINKKEKTIAAQGTIEYLIIVAVVIIIALVVIGILLSINPGTGVSERNAKIAWSSQEPWAITEWNVNSDGELTLVLKNNTSGTLEFNEISVGGETESDPQNVAPNAEIVIEIDMSSCSGTYSYGDIEIDYNSGNINNRTQYGATEIIGQCSN